LLSGDETSVEGEGSERLPQVRVPENLFEVFLGDHLEFEEDLTRGVLKQQPLLALDFQGALDIFRLDEPLFHQQFPKFRSTFLGFRPVRRICFPF
jgi:hypothetical protein